VAEAKKKPSVSVPGEEADRPGLARIGIVAMVCFAIGVLWPTLAGVRLVPEPPTKAKSDSPKEKASPRPKRTEDDESPSEVPAMQVEPQGQKVEAAIQVDEPLVVNCRDAQDRRESSCDKPGFDGVAKDRLIALMGCEAAGQPDGTLSIGFDLDFPSKKIRRILRGKSTTLEDSTADALIECAKNEFMSATLEGVEHTHARYLVFYGVRFLPSGAGETAEEALDPTVEVSGKATVVWNSARLRSTPEDGEVKATLMYGAKVVVTGRQGDWYRVKYDAKGNEAWVHKNALAL
jgi:hypothetical protein